MNRLRLISSQPSSTSAVSSAYGYNLANQRTSVTNADASYWLYGYDFLGQATNGWRFWSDGSEVLGQTFNYGFDDIGNRRSASSGASTALRTQTYSVNSLNEYTNRTVPGFIEANGSADVTAAVTVNGSATSRHSEYFRQEISANNSAAAVIQWLTNRAVIATGTSVVTRVNYLAQSPEVSTYDADGNLTQDGLWNYTWDGENRLLRMETRTNAITDTSYWQRLDFTYDYMSRRIRKQVSGWTGTAWTLIGSKRFLYDGWNLIGQVDEVTGVRLSFVWGTDLSGTAQGAGGVGGLVALVVHNGALAGTYFFAYDGNGNLVALVSGSDGSEAARYEYGPFGEVIRATRPMAKVNPFRFSTKYQDDETDLLYYGYRYYNGSTGRWLSRDPIEEEGALFRLLSNDPNNDSDYLGLVSIKDIKALITDSITESAEAIFNFLQNHPAKAWEISALNRLLPPLKRRAAHFFDTNTKTMGWRDIIFDWFFELGNTPFEFVDQDKTTEELKKHEGVNDARALAIKACAEGKHTAEKPWTYGVDQFYHSLSSADSIAIALGSYSVAVKSSSDCSELEFSVQNDSTWESATRFRKAATPGGLHQAILPNRLRGGPGIQLGGNMHEHWTWKEKCNKEKQQ